MPVDVISLELIEYVLVDCSAVLVMMENEESLVPVVMSFDVVNVKVEISFELVETTVVDSLVVVLKVTVEISLDVIEYVDVEDFSNVLITVEE